MLRLDDTVVPSPEPSSHMNPSACPAARLPEADRMNLAILALAGTATITDLAAGQNVSRKFVYQQANKVSSALAARGNGKSDGGPRRTEPALRERYARTRLRRYRGPLCNESGEQDAQVHDQLERPAAGACQITIPPLERPISDCFRAACTAEIIDANHAPGRAACPFFETCSAL